MTFIRPQVRVRGLSGQGATAVDRPLVRDVVRIVFFVPHDHFDISAGVSQVLHGYLRAVHASSAALATYTCCDWEPGKIDERGWELIRAALNPSVRRYAEDFSREEVSDAVKAGADPFFGLYGESDSGFSFEYHARIPWRQAPSDRVSVLRATLPTEYLEERGADFVSELALEWAFRLPFASGHAGLALDVAYPRLGRLETLRPLIFRHPGFDVRDAGIRDQVRTRIDGVHWMNFMGEPVLSALGGVTALRARLQSSSTNVREMDNDRVLVTLAPEPEAGDTARDQYLPAYHELARVLEPWLEPFPWDHLRDQGKAVDAEEWLRWWRRFLG